MCPAGWPIPTTRRTVISSNAWALIPGRRSFRPVRLARPRHRDRTRPRRDLRRKTGRTGPGTPILLPAEIGFVTQGGDHRQSVLHDAAGLAGGGAGHRCVGAGGCRARGPRPPHLMSEIASVQLVPDWVLLTGAGPQPDPRFSGNTGYEALPGAAVSRLVGRARPPGFAPCRGGVLRCAAHPPPAADRDRDRRTHRRCSSRQAATPVIAAISGLVTCVVNGGVGASISTL